MRNFFLLISLLFFIQVIHSQDFDPSTCDWENNSDYCFAQAQLEFNNEKAALDAEIAALQQQNDDVTTQINQEMDQVNQQVADLQAQMTTFQQEMDNAFQNMIPSDLMDELNNDLADLNGN